MSVCNKSEAYIHIIPTMQLEIYCMTITDMAAARYAQPTPHFTSHWSGPAALLEFLLREVFPHSSRYHSNTILSYKLTFLLFMRYKFHSQQSVIPPPPLSQLLPFVYSTQLFQPHCYYR
jgi:hypothetical protein